MTITKPFNDASVVGADESPAEYFGNVRTLGDLMRNDIPRPWMTALPQEVKPQSLVVWLGCNILRTAHMAESLNDILVHMGHDHALLGGPSHCCGSVHTASGLREVADNMLNRTMEKFDEFKPDQLLYWCPSCDDHLSHRDQSLVTETAKKRMNATVFLSRNIRQDLLVNEIPITVAIHRHVDFPEQEEESEAVHDLLSRIPGVHVIDAAAATGLGRHCTVPRIKDFGEEKYVGTIAGWMADAKRRGATHIVSIYHSCHRRLTLLQREHGGTRGLELVNYLTLVAQSMGLPAREDKFARISKIADIDTMMEELEGEFAARGVKPETVRRALKDQFEGGR
ncbi:heterodisulfide reductase-related iron-sulfur binding cluster [Bradyrhizobium sp.]|uniref:heterodisulfide reductase-related iron-sulfur binding cluster n=1 Tax=Bradyrhizobium sp. TaxID=376 RepID=UPI0025C44233|nr:heterodisulfide reductase-related iron-sulfur binding cluster [Bradyrhizobium sp.]